MKVIARRLMRGGELHQDVRADSLCNINDLLAEGEELVLMVQHRLRVSRAISLDYAGLRGEGSIPAECRQFARHSQRLASAFARMAIGLDRWPSEFACVSGSRTMIAGSLSSCIAGFHQSCRLSQSSGGHAF